MAEDWFPRQEEGNGPKKKNTTEVEPTVVPLNQKQWETWKLHRYWDFITGDSKSVSVEGLIKL